MACGNLGAPPKPPHSSSCCSPSCATAVARVSAGGKASLGDRSAWRAMDDVRRWPRPSSSPRRVGHASVTASST